MMKRSRKYNLHLEYLPYHHNLPACFEKNEKLTLNSIHIKIKILNVLIMCLHFQAQNTPGMQTTNLLVVMRIVACLRIKKGVAHHC